MSIFLGRIFPRHIHDHDKRNVRNMDNPNEKDEVRKVKALNLSMIENTSRSNLLSLKNLLKTIVSCNTSKELAGLR